MHSKFLNLNEEKQLRILNAAINEFARKGYEDASTNEIVKEAEISKGILFHYFKNKKQLYLFVYDYSMDIVIKEVYSKLDLNEKDIIERLRQVAGVKYDLMKVYPSIFQFAQKAYMETSTEVKDDLLVRNNDLIQETHVKMFGDIDVSKFKEGIDIGKAMNMIVWTFEGIATAELIKEKSIPGYVIDYDKVHEQSYEYLEMFKKCFYV